MRFVSRSGHHPRNPLRPLLGLAVCLLLVAAACGNHEVVAIDYTGAAKPPAPVKRIPDALKADTRLSKLAALVEAAGLNESLQGTGPITLFAPTDDAFAKLAATAPDLLDPDKVAKDEVLKAKLAELLKLHVVAQDVTFTEPAKKDGETTSARETRLKKAGLVYVDRDLTLDSLSTGKSLVIGRTRTVKTTGSKTQAQVVSADVTAPNGYIQVIDTVLSAS